MKSELQASTDPDMIGSAAALRRAGQRALQLGLETGTPVWVMKDGKIVDLTKQHRAGKKAKRKTS